MGCHFLLHVKRVEEIKSGVASAQHSQVRETQGRPLLPSWAEVRPGQTQYASGRNTEGAPSHLPPSFKAPPLLTFLPSQDHRHHCWQLSGQTAEAACDQTGPSHEGYGSGESSSPMAFLSSPPQAGGSGRRPGAKATEIPRHGFPALTSPLLSGVESP